MSEVNEELKKRLKQVLERRKEIQAYLSYIAKVLVKYEVIERVQVYDMKVQFVFADREFEIRGELAEHKAPFGYVNLLYESNGMALSALTLHLYPNSEVRIEGTEVTNQTRAIDKIIVGILQLLGEFESDPRP